MSASILVISNYRNSSMTYTSSLRGYGFSIDDTQTLEAARILLRAGNYPTAIAIDVKFHPEEIASFIQFVRADMTLQGINILVVGCEGDFFLAHGATNCLERPVNFQDIVKTSEPSL